MTAGVEAGRMDVNKEGFVGHGWVQRGGAVVGMCTGERGGEGGWDVVSWESRNPVSFLDCEAGSISDLPPQAELPGMAPEGRHSPHLGRHPRVP